MTDVGRPSGTVPRAVGVDAFETLVDNDAPGVDRSAIAKSGAVDARILGVGELRRGLEQKGAPWLEEE